MKVWFLALISLQSTAFGFSLQNLFLTPDQQGRSYMSQGQFDKAEQTFRDPKWQATAAYRAAHFALAAQNYLSLHNEWGFYNAGNALAHLGKYQQAIAAYDKALALNPQHEDAKYNRQLLEDLLKKQQQEKQDSQKKDEQKKQQQQNSASQNDSSKTDSSEKEQSQESQQDKQGQKEKTEAEPENKSNQEKKANKPETSSEQAKEKKNNNIEIRQQQEKQQAKNQWLRLIPDDPGGLLREKFLRDHLRREGEWYP